MKTDHRLIHEHADIDHALVRVKRDVCQPVKTGSNFHDNFRVKQLCYPARMHRSTLQCLQ